MKPSTLRRLELPAFLLFVFSVFGALFCAVALEDKTPATISLGIAIFAGWLSACVITEKQV